jgi:hypothetical protein
MYDTQQTAPEHATKLLIALGVSMKSVQPYAAKDPHVAKAGEDEGWSIADPTVGLF